MQKKQALAMQLRPLAESDTREHAFGSEPPFISAFVSRQRECIASFSTPSAGLVVIVEGRKQVQRGADIRNYGAGEAFLLSAGSRIEVINEPDQGSGIYRALFLCLSRELMIEAARLWPEFAGRSSPADRVALDAPLCAAILHAGEALSSASRRVVAHRLLEVILILAEQGVLQLAPKYVDGSVSDAVRLLVRHQLDRDWSGASVAASFGMSEATLRRRLRAEGQSLRDILLAARMQAAKVLLCDRNADVAEAIAATGYASRSHFARQFRQAFGMSPATARQMRGER
ncbi:helix-turn-helix transcriptional regulator [Faunimonas pinastri]|nr:helix-turn-helix domain-containing protein [Faunimonas pinastri]